jgi:hypothetical protein
MYLGWSSTKYPTLGLVALFVQLFDNKLDVLQFLKRVFSVDTLVKLPLL